MPEFEKLVRDGKVAVLVSPGYGAGWSTWADDDVAEALCMDADLVQAVIQKDISTAIRTAVERYGNSNIGLGADQLRVEWVPLGTQFRIDEYDGSESIVTSNETKWFTA